MRASCVNDPNHLRERAAEMRVSSKELKDSNTAAVILRLAELSVGLTVLSTTATQICPSRNTGATGVAPS